MEDRQLIISLKKGNREAFNLLFEKYSPKLHFFTLKSFQNKVDAEEIVQNTFLKIWETSYKIDENQHFTTYLITIAKHIIYDCLRHKLVERKYNQYILQSSDESYSIENDFVLKNLKEYLAISIGRLPTQQKEIILLKSKGYNNKEIAKQLKLSKRTVETHINRALKFLRSHLINKKEIFTIVIINILSRLLY
ncbi:MAG: RNA polymerase sigma-70 factor [Prevotellaceae bacterium]|jgi:RNA polymerase sigma-70 factor (ECF subfamily)|nr:RNA polymerase sigma-70 factor [Prevotellaceae bacterium]